MTSGDPGQKHAAKRDIIEWSVSIVLAVVLALAVNTWVGQLITVEGHSMNPTLLTGDKVIIGKVEYYFKSPKRGDIVLVRYPGSRLDYIKRVVATGGEHIMVSGGEVCINGKRLVEPYITAPIEYDMEETLVPEGSVFVMGDNRNDSSDSHTIGVGPIPLDQVEGRAYALAWPFGDIRTLTQYEGKLEQ